MVLHTLYCINTSICCIILYVYTYKKVCVHVYILLRNEQHAYIYFDLKCIIFITSGLFLFIIHMQSKCEEYFPLKVGEQKIFGPFRITTVSMTYQVEYKIRTIEIILVSVIIFAIYVYYTYIRICYMYTVLYFFNLSLYIYAYPIL